MTSWHPGEGAPGEDFLGHGDDSTPTRPVRLVAAAAFLLALGAVVGTRIDTLSWPGNNSSDVALTGGAVASARRIDDRHRFRVGLFNPAEETIRARVVGIVGMLTAVTHNGPVKVAPHSWGYAVFSLPAQCKEQALPGVSQIRVRVTDASGSGEQLVELAAPPTALTTVHERECAPATALSRRDLGGLWFLEDAEGRWADLAGSSLMRFTGDGRFAFDPEGRLFLEGGQGFFGTFRLEGTRLHLEADGGYACPKGYSEVWTTTSLGEDLLRLDVVDSDDGYCHSPPGERQLLRRLVPEDRLPPERPAG